MPVTVLHLWWSSRLRSSTASTSWNRFSGIQQPVLGSLIQNTSLMLVALPPSSDTPPFVVALNTAAAAEP